MLRKRFEVLLMHANELVDHDRLVLLHLEWNNFRLFQIEFLDEAVRVSVMAPLLFKAIIVLRNWT